jgi:hypothetical protein
VSEAFDPFSRHGSKKDPESRPRLEKIWTGRETVLRWMQVCIDADAIQLGSKSLSLGSDHVPTWIATDYLYESYRAACRQQGTWYPVDKRCFGRVLTKVLGPGHRSTTTPEDLAEIMFGPENRPRRPWGHFVPSGKIWQGLLDARLYIPKQARPTNMTPANELSA